MGNMCKGCTPGGLFTNCRECAEGIARTINSEPSDILNALYVRTKRLAAALRELMAAVDSGNDETIKKAREQGREALAAVNTLTTSSPAECVLRVYLKFQSWAAQSKAAGKEQ